MADSKSTIDLAFEEFENDCGGSKEIRREMINQLRKQVGKCEISEYDKPMMIQAKLMVIKTLDDVLKSDEDVSLKKLKMKLARKDSETNGMVGQTIVNLFKSIRAIGEPVDETQAAADQAAAQEAVRKRAEELKQSSDPKVAEALKVSEGEIQECGVGQSADQPERPADEPTDD